MDTNELAHDQVLQRLQTRWLARPYVYVSETDSTNDLLKQRLKAGTAVPGMMILANYQRLGRGRLNRRWEAPAGTSLLLSVLLQPNWPVAQAQWLTMIASVAAAEAVTAVTGLTVGIKWPNDLMLPVNGRWHKFAGLLLEADMWADGYLHSAVLGLGMNVNIPAGDMPEAITPPTSLMAVAGREISRLDLLVEILKNIEAVYERALGGQSPHAAWNGRLINIGQPVTVTLPNQQRLAGLCTGTTPWGELLVATDDGTVHTLAAGDVTLREN